MTSILSKGLVILTCCGLAACRAQPIQNEVAAQHQPTQSATLEIILTRHPAPDLTDNYFNLAWAKVSQNNKRYKLFRPKDSPVAGMRPFQCRILGECFVIVADQRVKDASRYKILVLSASDKGRNYQSYWVTSNHDLSRTSLWNSNIGVVAIEHLDAGGHKVSVLKWDQDGQSFTCTQISSHSLVFPVD